MPLYEYACPTCGTFELIRKFADAPLEKCPTCAAAVTKQVSSPAFQFKGTGWYVTDYARKGQSEKKDGATGQSAPASETKSSDSKPSDGKPAAAPTSTPAAAKSAD